MIEFEEEWFFLFQYNVPFRKVAHVPAPWNYIYGTKLVVN